jgi:adenine-specific DNA methylase
VSGAAIQFDEFPSTRYQGSKRKIVSWIHEVLSELEFCTALDLFGGSATVSYLLKKMGKRVTYNDCLRFNFVIGKALIENDSAVLNAEEVNSLSASVGDGEDGFVAKTFRGMYFTPAENRWIDAVCTRIADVENSLGGDMKAALAYYALFQSCLVKRPFNLFHRKNLYLRRARVERTFGNKTTWERPFAEHFKAFVAEVNALIFKGAAPCRATNLDASTYPSAEYDLVYIDPPYLRTGGRQETADYRRCYHFLEGLANYNRWDEMVDLETPNHRLRVGAANVWCNPEKSGDALDELLTRFPQSIVAISYRKYGTPSLATLVRLLRRHGRKVETHTRHYKYALNHQNGDASLNREALIIGRKGR